MGGFGSGRGQRGKDTTSDMRVLDIRRLQRDGLLTPGQLFIWKWSRNGDETASIRIRTESDRVMLSYRSRSHEGEWQPQEYPVYLERRGCNFGGRRVWFRCPAPGCGRRAAILFGGAVFACRHCHKLAYASQRETDDDRAARRAEAIRRRLGWKAGILNGEGGKPKGMHWHTFSRLKAEHDAFAQIFLVGMMRRLRRFERRLAGFQEWLDRDG
jgi:hypothetical protein